MSGDQIAPYISRREYACPCCGALPPSFSETAPSPAFRELFAAFERIRNTWGKPIPINSGYRCPIHNAAIDGAYLSAHVFGMAFDLQAGSAGTVLDLRDAARISWPGIRIGWKRYINDKSYIVHIDAAYLIDPSPSSHFARGVEW